MFATALSSRAARLRRDPPARREDLVADPLAVPPAAIDSALAGVVEEVVVVDPVAKRYRAVITRTVTQSAVVEFTALEGENTQTLAEALLPTIAPELWTTDPVNTWGYIDRIEEVVDVAIEAEPEPAVTDPAAAPAALSRRLAKMARKMALSAADVIAEVDALRAEAQAMLDAAGTWDSAEEVDGALAQLESIAATVEALEFDGTDPDGEAEAMTAAQELMTWLDEQILILGDARAALDVEADGGLAEVDLGF